MTDPTFAPAERSNLVLPIVLAGVMLAGAVWLLLRYTPHTTATVTIPHTAVWQAHTVFKSDTMLVGRDAAQDDLYVLAKVRVRDDLKLPLFLKDFTGTLTTAAGTVLEASAAEKLELGPLLTTFPALQPLASAPLLRETAIQPGASAEGMVVLHFPATEEAWRRRQSATLTVAFYHQAPQTVTLPKP